MKFDSIAAISEIAKFYGKLDDVFRLLNWLNTTTRRIWTEIWVRLSQDVSRKPIKIDRNDREMLCDILTENKYVPSLFQPNPIHANSTEYLKMLQELVEKIDNPQMMNMLIGLNISSKRDTLLTLSNYTEYMEYTIFSNLEQYNKIIETAISRQINFDLFNCFVFIHKIPALNEIKFIRSILFPWNSDFKAESMIRIWNDFWEKKMFDFKVVVLIWGDMGLDEFMKVFLAVSKTKTNLRIHTSKYYEEFNKLFDNLWLNQLNSISIKLWDNDEFILWELLRQSNKINLRKWYYQSSWSPHKMFEISNWCLKYQDGFQKSGTNKLSIEFDKVQWLSFYCLPVALTNQELKKNSNQIYFDENNLQIDMWAIKYASFNVINDNDEIHILDQCITVNNNLNPKVKYFKNDNLIDLEITNMSLEKDDVSNLIKKIQQFGNIKTLSLKVNEPSSAIDILSWCRKASSITSISLEVWKGFSLSQSNKLRKIVKGLKCQGISAYIYKPNNTPKILSL